ncbi:MAG: aldo/keto reductase [Bacteroidota bacterium]
MSMEYIELAPNFNIARLLVGLWQIADMEKDGETLDPAQTMRSIAPYVEKGLTTFDMADHYGSAEILTGHFRKHHALGPQTQLLTKWVPKPGRLEKKDVREAVATALRRMQSEQLDLLQYHAWNYADPTWLDQMFWLQELKEEGLIAQVGVTNMDTAHLRMLLTSGIEVATNQVCFSLLDQRAAGAMSRLSQEFGVKVLAFGTLAGGFLSEKWLNQPEPDIDRLANWSLMKYKRFIDQVADWSSFQDLLHALKKIANQYGVSIPNVATRFILDQPAVAGVIVGARLGERQHIEDNLRVFEFVLSDESRKVIQAKLDQLSPVPGDCGDEYRRPPFLTASGDLSHHLEEMPNPYPTTLLPNGDQKIFSGVPWEKEYGYCRAVRKGNRILVSGTTASHGNRLIGGSDPDAQAHFVIDKIEGAIQSLGGQLSDVARTRIFVPPGGDWAAVARAHGQRFGDIQPANTLVHAQLVGEEFLVEMEAEAVIS